MTLGYIQPNSDNVPNDWLPISTEYTLIDEARGSPNTTDYISATNLTGDDNKVSEFGFPNTINDVDEVTQIIVYSYGIKVGTPTPEVDLYIGGGWRGYQECSVTTGWGWVGDTWNGSWTQAELNAVQVRYRADVPNKNDVNQISCVYLRVTYTQVVLGYGHDFMGVPAANIDSVNGVPTANIDNIKGVV